MLNAFSFNDEEEEKHDEEEEKQEKWGRRTPTRMQNICKRPPSRQRGLFPTHLNSSGFMPPTVPRGMTPRKRHPAEKRILKRTHSSASTGSTRTKKAVWVSRPRSRHRPPGESLFLRLPPKKGRNGGISEDRTSSKTRIIWGDAQDELERQKITRRRLKQSKRKKKKKKKKKKKDDTDTENDDDDDDSNHDRDKNEGEEKKKDKERGSRSRRPMSRNLKSRNAVAPKIRHLGRRSVVSRRKHKSGKIQLLLLTDSSDSEAESSDDAIGDRRVTKNTSNKDPNGIIDDDRDLQSATTLSTSEILKDKTYEDALETSSLDYGFLSLFANKHDVSTRYKGK